MAKVEDTAELIKNEADIGNAPAIQVHGFPGTKESPSNRGIDNPIFSFENVETGRTVTVKEEADGHSNSNGSVSTVRRGSNISGGISGAHDTLAVPGSQVSLLRRGSQASVTSSGKSAISVWKRKSLRATVSIDSLSADHTHKQSWKSISRLARSRSAGSTRSLKSLSSVIGEEKSDVVHERIRNLVNAFSERAWRIKERVAQPPTPTESDSGRSTPEVETKKQPQRFDSFIEDTLHRQEEPLYVDILGRKLKLPGFLRCKVPKKLAIDPQGTWYLMWLFLLTCAYTYNCWSMFLRASFPYETESNRAYWLIADYICDLLYLLDIVIVKSHIIFLDEGIFVDDRKAMEKNYVKTTNFKCDVASLLPLDILYLAVGVKPMLRLPRLLKIQTFWEFYTRFDAVAKAPHAIRVFKTFTYMLFMIHIQTCAFYAFSEYERNQGIVSDWIHKNEGNAYIRCFYFATKTATSIGNNPKPEQLNEFLYMTVSWLLGVFVFALLIGQVRDIFQAARMTKTEYRKTMDITINYMQNLKVPSDLQDRVRLWFNYNWEQQKTLNENAALQILPLKMRTDMAINVHFQTLSKVQLFQDCEKGLLRVLVLRLRPVLYLPGDLVCRKGDVGHEMYIVNNGQVQVMGGEKNDIVLATLHSGSVFGEISLLSLAGGNRRTADVKSRGFSNLFVLSKADLQDTIKDYPDAQEALKRKAKKIIAQNAKRERKPSIKEEDVKLKPSTRLSSHTPKLVTAVIEALDKNPSTHDNETTQILTGRKSRLQVQSSMEMRSTPEEVLVVETTQDGPKEETQISLKNSLSPTTTERRSRLLKMHSIHENNKKVDDEQRSDSALGNTMSSSLDTVDKNKETKEVPKDNKAASSLESGISLEDTTSKIEKKKKVSKNQVAPQEGPLNVWNESKFDRTRPVSIVQPMVNGMPLQQQQSAKETSSSYKESDDTSRNVDTAALPGQTDAGVNATANTESVAASGNLINESIDFDVQPHELATLRRASITPSLMSASLDLEDNMQHDARTLDAEVTVHQESSAVSSSSAGVDNLAYVPESDSPNAVKHKPPKS